MTASKEHLAALLERVEKAEKSSALLDLDIAKALGLTPTGKEWTQTASNTWHKNLRQDWNGQRFDDCFQPQLYTYSIDSAVALVEKTFPDRRWEVDRNGHAIIYYHDHSRYHDAIRGDAETPALALCAALLRALIARVPLPPEDVE